MKQPFQKKKPASGNNKKKSGKGGDKKPRFSFYWIYVIVILVLLGVHFFSFDSSIKEITWQEFKRDMMEQQEVDKLVVVNKQRVEVFIKPDELKKEKHQDVSETSFGMDNKGPHYFFTIGSVDVFEENLDKVQADTSPEKKLNVRYVSRRDWGVEILTWMIPIMLIVALWIFIMRKMSGGGMGGPGGQIFNIGKSKATLFDKDAKVSVTFNDVAGLEEAKEEVMEVVDFLRKPKRYTELGGKIPKGVLLIGSPGTGKTLLAKAMAGEAKVPFFSISGSDFVEMFVGVGASRVRDLFKQAREKAPCIIFIDEIDAVGKRRGKNMVQGGNDERENTLNQLLNEMDGFSSEAGIIILAATNRPDVLDPALMRPGRFDRQIVIEKPDINGREAIFKVHMKGIKTEKEVDVKRLAALTPGFAGAEIANVCNEAALIAARRRRKKVQLQDFQDAIDRVIGGLEKKNKLISPEEKRIIAYHESGHAIVGWFLEYADPLVKVSIVPRGMAALGYAQYLPKEQYLYTKDQIMDSLCMAIGGRAAEELIFGRISTGAQNDLERITRIVYDMIIMYGMNEKIGHVSFNPNRDDYAFKKPYSEQTARMIDEEARILIAEAYKRTLRLLKKHKKTLGKVAEALLEKEILFQADLEKLIGKRPFPVHYKHYSDGEEKAEKRKRTGKAKRKAKRKPADHTKKEKGATEASASSNGKDTRTSKTEEKDPSEAKDRTSRNRDKG